MTSKFGRIWKAAAFIAASSIQPNAKVIPAGFKAIHNLCCHVKFQQEARRNVHTGVHPELRISPIENLAIDVKKKYLNVEYAGKRDILEFPLVWLRDACLCADCHDPSSGGRLTMLNDLDPDLSARSVKLLPESGHVEITWEDGHTSHYSPEWLWERRYTETAREQRKTDLALKPIPWGSERQQDIPTGDFKNIMNDDRAFYDWLVAMEEVGLCLIKGAPREQGVIHQIGKRVAYVRKTCYGEEFLVRSKISPTDLAFTGVALGLHCDMPYYNFTPGVQMLHCISQVQSKGGENQFSDGFNAAQIMREEYPEHFHLLTKYKFDYIDVGEDAYPYHMLNSIPCIWLNDEGDVERVVLDDQKRAYHTNNLPIHIVRPLYKAMRKLYEVMYEPRNLVQYKLQPGDIVTFHNYRVLHARSAFSVTSGGERFLTGGFVDWDEMRSSRRRLMNKLGL